MEPAIIKTSRGLINLNNVTVIEKVDGYDSMKYSIRFALHMQQSAIYESYDTEEERNAVYDKLFYEFGYDL